MRVFITGGTGLIGKRLAKRLLDRGDQPVVLSRSADRARLNPALAGVEVIQGDPAVSGPWESALNGCHAVINLAGHNIFAQRWSPDVKREIKNSRVASTQHVVEAVHHAASPPRVLVQASAIGYYGPSADQTISESTPPGKDFMADVCVAWEAAAQPVESLGVRLATVRIGVVLAPGEGALGVMTPIFKWLPGGAAPVGNGGGLLPAQGRQWMSWIHVDDIVGILLLALDNPQARGPINGTAPHPVRNIDFGRALAKAVHRPFIPLGPPDFVLKTVLGEVADVVTKGAKVMPDRALALGYQFLYPELAAALAQIFGRAPSAASGSPSNTPSQSEQPVAAGS
jgi:uncharacterized protein (TIGR01777 family)